MTDITLRQITSDTTKAARWSALLLQLGLAEDATVKDAMNAIARRNDGAEVSA